MTTYIVAGWPRSGTSREIEALIAGGMTAVWNPHRSKAARWASTMDFKVNDDLYELSSKQYGAAGFPRAYEGKLIKVLGENILRVVPGQYKVVFLTRKPTSIGESYLTAFGRPIDVEDYHERVANLLGTLALRHDMDIHVADFDNVTADPMQHFTNLRDFDWPVGVGKAASVIDPKKVRF